jgi:hypothetical protein
VLSNSTGNPALNEILWNFSHHSGKEHLSLAQNLRFYTGLPTKPRGYKATFSSRPTESYNGTIYVLTNDSHRIFFEFHGRLRAFDHVWNTNKVLIFRGERITARSFLVLTDMFADVVGNLGGETTIQGSIQATPPFIYRTESMQQPPEEVRKWGDIFRRLRDRLKEASGSFSHWHVRISTRP